MTTRIPQLYQPRRPMDSPTGSDHVDPFANPPSVSSHSHSHSPSTPSSRTMPSPSGLGAPANDSSRDSANYSSIGGLLLAGVGGGDRDSWVANVPPPPPVPESPTVSVRTGRTRASTIIETKGYVQVDRAALHARIRSLEAAVGTSSEDGYDDEPITFNPAAPQSQPQQQHRAPGAHAQGKQQARASPTSPRAPPPHGSRVPESLSHESYSPTSQGSYSPIAPPMPVSTPPLHISTRSPTSVRGPSPVRSGSTPEPGQHSTPVFSNPDRRAAPSPRAAQPSPRSVVVDFPMPNMHNGYARGSPTAGPGTPTSTSRGYTPGMPGPASGPGYSPQPSYSQPMPSPRPQRPHIQIQVPVMPAIASSAPISPMLAAPPRAHFAEPSSPAGGSDNASLRAFDGLREKAATFREGEEEILTPFSTRRETGPRNQQQRRSRWGRLSTVRPVSNYDLWKRISIVQKSGLHDKESGFITQKKRSIWKNPYFVFPLIITLLAVGAVVTWAVIKIYNQPTLYVEDPATATASATRI